MMAYLNHNILILLLASIYMVGIIHGMKNITSGPGDYYKNINPDGGDLKAQLQPLLLNHKVLSNGSEPTIIFTILLIITLLVFGFFFAINSSLHSYLILLFSPKERVNMNVGFYYTANAAGRLIGTFLSGLSYIFGGLTMCMVVSASMLFLAWYFTNKMVRSGNSRNKII